MYRELVYVDALLLFDSQVIGRLVELERQYTNDLKVKHLRNHFGCVKNIIYRTLSVYISFAGSQKESLLLDLNDSGLQWKISLLLPSYY